MEEDDYCFRVWWTFWGCCLLGGILACWEGFWRAGCIWFEVYTALLIQFSWKAWNVWLWGFHILICGFELCSLPLAKEKRCGCVRALYMCVYGVAVCDICFLVLMESAAVCDICFFFLMESAAVCDICMEFTMNIDCSTMVFLRWLDYQIRPLGRIDFFFKCLVTVLRSPSVNSNW